MDQQILQDFKNSIKGQGCQRYRIKHDRSDVAILLMVCYQEIVSRRRIVFCDSPELQSNINKVVTWLVEDRRPGLLLYGNYGAGKTTMGKAISLLISNLNAVNVVFQTTSRELGNVAAVDVEAFNNLKKVKMLYIDEVGREQLTVQNYGNKINPFIELLEYRYDRQLFTILTANLTDEEILDRYGVYIDERITENFDKINYTNKSYRTGK